jgi:bifunctional non-homologous end joining protein LigD
VAPRRASKRESGQERSARLGSYRAKRDFAKTPEPSDDEADARSHSRGRDGRKSAAGQARFVIHEHSATRLHWDLRLERDGVLASWAIPKGLPPEPKDNRLAVWTENHPLEYVDFHGEIPEGQYGAGTMTIWDHGTYECLKWEPRKIEVALHGERVDARYALFPISKEEQSKEWMIHRMDPAADPEREPLPEHLEPMLARAGALPPEDGRWAYEIKWDGIRAIAYCQPGKVTLESRNLNDISSRYPELRRLDRALSSHTAVLDGEVVAFDEQGRPSFEALQRRMHVESPSQVKRLAKGSPLTYMIFDLLWLDGHSLMDLPYSERRARLAELQLSGESWQTPDHLPGPGADVLAATADQGLEGVVAKRLDSTYTPGTRATSWVKIKNIGRQEVVIGGWVPGEGRRKERIGALLVGVHGRDGELRYAGRVGTGFSGEELDRLAKLLAPLERASSPFDPGASKPPRGAVFTEPRLVAEIEFTEWTKAGSLRHPSYKGLRTDKPAEQVVREDGPATSGAPREKAEQDAQGALALPAEGHKQAVVAVDGRELKLSNLDKLLYARASFSKRDVIDYYAAVAASLLPHLHDRALTVTRWPDGVDGKSFFQKQAPAHRPRWVRTTTIEHQRKAVDYVLADDLSTLVWLANLAALELHTPLALARAIERPTTLVFDLDPGEPATIVECCEVGVRLHDMFENLGLQSFAKTSGSKGLQIYVPLNSPKASFEHTKPFAKAVAELLESDQPGLIVSRMTKTQRKGKVLIDWSQNDIRKTTVCVYSLRARERPTVSTPLAWEEVRAALASGDPGDLAFEAAAVLERIGERGDLFAPVLSLVQELPSL